MNLDTLTVQTHRDNVGRLRCVVSGAPDPTLHHAQGPSIHRRLAAMGLDSSKSMSQRGNGEALIIPLAARYHAWDGTGIDGNLGRRTWEELFGEQAEYVDEVSELVGYSLWELHILWLPLRATFRPQSSTG